MSTERCDVAVVGAGLVGTATAYELARLGADTVIVDEHDPGRATDAGAGILSPETNTGLEGGRLDFALAAAEHYRSLVPGLVEEGAADTGYATCGLLKVAVRAGEDDLFATDAALLTARHLGVVTEVAAAEAADRFPPLAPVRRALFSPVAARVDGRAINAALAHGAQRRGARLLVTRAERLVVSGTRALGVETAAGRVDCGAVVLAGGAWTGRLTEGLGPPLAVRPLKGQIVHLQVPGADSASWPILQPVLSYYLVAWPGGRVVCGGTMEAAAGFDHRATAGGVAELLRECLINAPGLAGATLSEVRVGLRPASADGDPLLGPLPGLDNVHLATGHGTEGLLLGPYSGLVVARAVLGEPLDPALAPFSPARFS
ncbi:MAG: NAD(P)/FAD-dependent oxidoreductase [Acidimicrobiales bacterium]